MSTEVERSQVDSGLTAASSGGAAERSQNKPEGSLLLKEQDEQGSTGSEKQLSDGTSSETSLDSTDMHKKLKENDKENDQSDTADSAVETVKRKVVEAPPPKVNPWTKRTTGRVPSSNIASQEKGESLLNPTHEADWLGLVAKLAAPPPSLQAAADFLWQLYCGEKNPL